MPRQNRVDPNGRIRALPGTGLFMGNRGGPLHDDSGVIVREQKGRAWIICLTSYKGRQRVIGAPGRYTELFFLDEATALSAGHRPCFECRRADANRFIERWRRTKRGGQSELRHLDAALAAERRVPRSPVGTGKRAYQTDPAELPDGVMVEVDGAPHLVLDGALRQWTSEKYTETRAMPDEAWVLTPRSAVRVLASGYRPVLHDSARS